MAEELPKWSPGPDVPLWCEGKDAPAWDCCVTIPPGPYCRARLCCDDCLSGRWVAWSEIEYILDGFGRYYFQADGICYYVQALADSEATITTGAYVPPASRTEFASCTACWNALGTRVGAFDLLAEVDDGGVVTQGLAGEGFEIALSGGCWGTAGTYYPPNAVGGESFVIIGGASRHYATCEWCFEIGLHVVSDPGPDAVVQTCVSRDEVLGAYPDSAWTGWVNIAGGKRWRAKVMNVTVVPA